MWEKGHIGFSNSLDIYSATCKALQNTVVIQGFWACWGSQQQVLLVHTPVSVCLFEHAYIA